MFLPPLVLFGGVVMAGITLCPCEFPANPAYPCDGTEQCLADRDFRHVFDDDYGSPAKAFDRVPQGFRIPMLERSVNRRSGNPGPWRVIMVDKHRTQLTPGTGILTAPMEETAVCPLNSCPIGGPGGGCGGDACGSAFILCPDGTTVWGEAHCYVQPIGGGPVNCFEWPDCAICNCVCLGDLPASACPSLPPPFDPGDWAGGGTCDDPLDCDLFNFSWCPWGDQDPGGEDTCADDWDDCPLCDCAIGDCGPLGSS